MNGFVGAVVGGFEFAGRLVLGVGTVVEAAIGERAAQAFVEEQEEERDVESFGRQAVGVTASIALQQAMPFELAQIIAKLVECVIVPGELEGGEDGFVDLCGRPAADGVAAS